jgi:hypothetical protein
VARKGGQFRPTISHHGTHRPGPNHKLLFRVPERQARVSTRTEC